MLRTDVINYMISEMNYKSYLEIGIAEGNNFRSIKCDKKISVDPKRECEELIHEMTSDDFFIQNKEMFDIIFIDGHHDSEYVCRDFNNSLKILNPNGVIIAHDCYPPVKSAACKLAERSGKLSMGNPLEDAWCGDGFKVINSIVKNYKNNLECWVLDTDWGIGIISNKAGIQEIKYDDSYTWEQMMQNPKDEINLLELKELFNVILKLKGNIK